MWFVYILRCADDALYVGHTHDLDGRLRWHNDGRGSKFTASRRPVCLLYSEGAETQPGAIARERQLKRWTRRKKDALIAGDLCLLKAL